MGKSVRTRNYIIKDSIYGFSWDIYIGSSLNNAIKCFCKKLKIAPWTHEIEGIGHFGTLNPLKAGFIWFKYPPKNYPGVLAHECFHAVSYLSERLNIKLDSNSEEFFSYYLQWLVEEILLN